MSDKVEDLNDREKAAALEDLMSAYREEWFDIVDHWVQIDGSADVSDETVRVLTLMRTEVRKGLDS